MLLCLVWNQIYYNPLVTYVPGLNANGTSMAAASTTATSVDPYLSSSYGPINIATRCVYSGTLTLPLYDPTTFATNSNCTNTTSSTTNVVARYAFYYNRKGTTAPTGGTNTKTTTDSRGNQIITHYRNRGRCQLYAGRHSSFHSNICAHTDRTDCAAAPTCTYAEEIKNFANWFLITGHGF